MKIFIASIFGLSLLQGCSQSKTPTTQTPSFNTASFTSIGQSVVQVETRFATYFSAAERLSMIDADALTEVWGKDVGPSFEKAFSIAGGENIAALRGDTLSIHAEGQEKTFSLGNRQIGESWVYHQESAMFAFIAAVDKKLRIVRFLSDNSWQELSVDLKDFLSADESTAQLMLSKDGTTLVLANTANASYLVFAASGKGSVLGGPVKTCSVTADTSVKDLSNLTASVLLDSNELAVMGTSKGAVIVLDIKPSNSCSWHQLSLSDKSIQHLSGVSSTQVAASIADGTLQILEVTKSLVNSVSSRAVCTLLAETIMVDSQKFLSLCSSSEGAANHQMFDLYVSKDLASTAEKLLSLSSAETDQFIFDQKEKRIFFIQKDAFGHFFSVSLNTGERKEKRDLFLQGILK